MRLTKIAKEEIEKRRRMQLEKRYPVTFIGGESILRGRGITKCV